jgi:acetate kinase
VTESRTRGLPTETGPGDVAPTPPDRSHILTVNGGSSSLKFALFEQAEAPVRRASGRIERIGLPQPRLVVAGAGRTRHEATVEAPDQQAAAGLLIDWLRREVGLGAVAAVGHRVVHGGGRYYRPEPVTEELLAELRQIGCYDPEHLPGELELIEAFRNLDPALPQFACFDTAFHHDLPRVARIVPIPRRFEAAGVRRYGFHGLSYNFLMDELERVAGPDAARGRVILAHLGSGASLAAVHRGEPVETTMGFTPASGLVMGTRSGDLDPGLVRFLMKAEGLSAEAFHALVNHESGLMGVSETSPDLRDLLARQGEDVRAAEAVELFCYRAKTGIGALAAALGGLGTLVFAGGIGENAPEVRGRICDGLGFLGIALDGPRNAAGQAVISADGAPVTVRVIPTDEEVMIARAAAGILRGAAACPAIAISRSP